MLGVLAVALALSSPLPPPRPSDLPSDDHVAMVAPVNEPAHRTPPEPSGVAIASTSEPPLPVPAERPDTGRSAEAAAAGESDTGTAAPETSRAGERSAETAPNPGGTVVPLPPERPGAKPNESKEENATLAAVLPLASPDNDVPGGGEADHTPDEHDMGAPPADAPRPVARPDQPVPGQTVGGAPVIRAMLVPGQNPSMHPRGTTPRNMVCRDPRIVGSPAASFVGGIPGCGIFEPVRVASIGGIKLSAPITVDCRTARTFADWLTGVAQPAARETLGSQIRSLWVMGSYNCRTRNHKPGARLSEHSAGRAIDVGGVTLTDGRRVTVRDHWNEGAPGTFLRRAWKGACGSFTTVIGPGGDRHHLDHLHLDTAYRSSTYCR